MTDDPEAIALCEWCDEEGLLYRHDGTVVRCRWVVDGLVGERGEPAHSCRRPVLPRGSWGSACQALQSAASASCSV